MPCIFNISKIVKLTFPDSFNELKKVINEKWDKFLLKI